MQPVPIAPDTRATPDASVAGQPESSGFGAGRTTADAPSLAELVSTLQGTDSHHDFSRGNTLPLVVMPHGMTAWTPQTDEGRWVFDARAPKIQGIRATHQPSPWMGDYGQFLIMATAGDTPPTRVDHSESFYRPAETVAHPHYFRTRLHRHDIVVEMTPTERGACLVYTFRQDAPAWIAFKLAEGTSIEFDPETRRVRGVSTAQQGGVPANFGCHFVANLSVRVLEWARFDAPGTSVDRQGPAAGLWLRIERPANGRVVLKVATSFIDRAQAELNAKRELSEHSWTSLLQRAHTAWNQRLGVITLDGASESQRRTFYGCLYRCLQFPRQWHERNGEGQRVHFSPFDGRVHPGPLYVDCGFWDVYRTLLPLLTIIDPELVADMISGWINIYREGGWLPNWASPGYRPCMVGSHGPAVIADAYLKGIRDFDAAAAYAAVRQDAMVDPHGSDRGREGLEDYRRLGYVPSDRVPHSVARTTDYAHGDFGAAQLAAALGHHDDAQGFRERAGNFRHVFERETGFLRGRLADGRWRTPFREFEWSSDYIEGSAWQFNWAAPHDVAGLIELMGGPDPFVARLDRMLALPPRFETGAYPREIHEMTEMAAADFGQYAHSNEPVHHALYLYTYAGRPDRTQFWVRRVVDDLYSENGYPGDEDNGAMSAWYILSTLGLFPVAVGHPAYVLGAPRHPRATLHLSSGRTFVIEAQGDVESRCHVAAVELNDRPTESLEISHAAITAGGRLTFAMTDDPRLAAARGNLTPPFSLSTASS